MKIIVCGAGKVGSNIARHLALENHDVTIVDQSETLVRQISDAHDVNGIVGHGSHPDVLERAGIADADLLIAVTLADETNMVACQVAHSLFGVPTKIARIRHQSYLQPMWANMFSRDHMPIDVIISPEIEVARAVTRRLEVPGAFEMIPLVDNKVKLLGVRCKPDCPLVNTPLKQLSQLFPDLNIVIVGLIREGKPIVPRGEDQMHAGDEVYFVVDSAQIDRAMAAFGHEEREARSLLIFGGGNIGMFLAKELEDNHDWVRAKIIESNKERAEEIAGQLTKTIVITGSRTEVRGKPGVQANGTTTGLVGATVQARVHLAGEVDYYDGSKRAVNDDGTFVWSRRTGKKTYVFFTAEDGTIRSNRVVIQAN